mmetsp:Transcript_37352/g.89839  ORF Transcript_37352/g.89839 Transcript_37352/m.89839 type:complete len:235 (+) Transcript_37352:846-1550(+)
MTPWRLRAFGGTSASRATALQDQCRKLSIQDVVAFASDTAVDFWRRASRCRTLLPWNPAISCSSKSRAGFRPVAVLTGGDIGTTIVTHGFRASASIPLGLSSFLSSVPLSEGTDTGMEAHEALGEAVADETAETPARAKARTAACLPKGTSATTGSKEAGRQASELGLVRRWLSADPWRCDAVAPWCPRRRPLADTTGAPGLVRLTTSTPPCSLVAVATGGRVFTALFGEPANT